jgi:hypothetical protein
MKIENQELLEQLYGKKLAVLRDQNSTLAQVLEAYKATPEKEAENGPYADYDDEKRFQRHVVKAAFKERIAALLNEAKTFDEAFVIYKAIPKIPKKVTLAVAVTKEQAALHALGLADCRQALAVYRYAPCGFIGEQALAKASRLAKTQDELWQMAVHSQAFGNRKLWIQAVKKLASKLK